MATNSKNLFHEAANDRQLGKSEQYFTKFCLYNFFGQKKGYYLHLDTSNPNDNLLAEYQQITEQQYQSLTEITPRQSATAVYNFVLANLAAGKLTTAKYALLSTLDKTLIEKHAQAITKPELAQLKTDIEIIINNPETLQNHELFVQIPVTKNISLFELINLLEEHRSSIIINLKHLQENYQRKGINRIEGSRDEKGNLLEPTLKTENIDNAEYVQMGSLAINRHTATINLLLTRKVRLINPETNTPITEVAGVLLTDLNKYNDYTIVSNGELHINSLQVKINNKKLLNLLQSKGVLAAGEFDFRTEYEIKLDNLPIIACQENYSHLDGVFEELAAIKVLASIISAYLRDDSEIFTQEQLQELKQHYLSKNLYVNFPTTTEYADLETALAKGEVASRISYKIDIGNKNILNLSKFYSANQFLSRIYEAYNLETGEKISKPNFAVSLDIPLIFGHKDLSRRTKFTQVDRFMRPIFDNFLGIEDNGSVAAILSKTGANSLLRVLQAKWKGEAITRDEFVEALAAAKSKLEKYIEQLYREKISPLVFYIGSTGLLPDAMDATAYTAEELSFQYPDLSFSKHEREGMFFVVGETIISVYPEKEYYSR
ncbi:hypothetical protein [Oscillatoria salina]|uniref:hypothetical protein n=1 Tax=Oscillatoria salina TaxID=331517 RepID=UPI001CCBD545|nr:hypothetical protein [Oscillatoria salina]